MIFLPLIFLEKASYSKLGSNVFKSLPSPFIQCVSMKCRLCARRIWGFQEENKDFCLSQGTRQVIKVRYSKYSISEAIACWKPCKKENGAGYERRAARVSTSGGGQHPSADGQGHGG